MTRDDLHGAWPTRQQARSTKWQSSPTMRPPPSSRRWIQWSGAMAPGVDADERPSPATARRASTVRTVRVSGEKRRLKPTVSDRRSRAAPATTSASSSSVRASGFSTNTVLPARSALPASAACEAWRVAMTTARGLGVGEDFVRRAGAEGEAVALGDVAGAQPRGGVHAARREARVRGEGRQQGGGGEVAGAEEADAHGARGALRSRPARLRPADADPDPLRLGLALPGTRAARPSDSRLGLRDRRVGLGRVVHREAVRDQRLDVQPALGDEAEDLGHVALLGPAHVAGRVVDGQLLVQGVVAPGPVRARELERELLLVERRAGHVHADVADHDHRAAVAGELAGELDRARRPWCRR